MIVLDTNVIAEVARGADADPRVLGWLRSLREPVTTTIVTRAEIASGLELLPQGRRRDALSFGMAQALARTAPPLEFTRECVPRYATVVTLRTHAGLPVATADAMIAATCLAHGLPLATRNTPDFEAVGLDLVNPWNS